jgi:hypothetical protein
MKRHDEAPHLSYAEVKAVGGIGMSMPESGENRAHLPQPGRLANEMDYPIRDNAGLLGFVSRLEQKVLGEKSGKGLSKRHSLYGEIGILHADAL